MIRTRPELDLPAASGGPDEPEGTRQAPRWRLICIVNDMLHALGLYVNMDVEHIVCMSNVDAGVDEDVD